MTAVVHVLSTATPGQPAKHSQPAAPPVSRLAGFAPNWFAVVMGTGIVSTSLAGLPIAVPYRVPVAVAFWVLTSVLLAAISTATVLHWRRHPEAARAHLRHPVIGHFYGAAPMAVLTTGAATLLAGRHVVGLGAAVSIDWTAWSIGTLAGLAGAVLVPRAQRSVRTDPFGGWLMPIVSPTVSATGAALLIPYCAAPNALLVAGYLLVAASLIPSAAVIGRVIVQLVRHGSGPRELAPTVWIVLGPLGQGTTALCLLAGHSDWSWARATGTSAALVLAVAAALWLPVALILVVRVAMARGLPFGLPWWSFTFPLGTCVTGAGALAARTATPALHPVAGTLFGALVLAWLVVAVGTVRGLITGRLLRA